MKGKENDGIFAKKIKKVHFRDSVKTASSFDFLPTWNKFVSIFRNVNSPEISNGIWKDNA